jgi:peroxiredoxin
MPPLHETMKLMKTNKNRSVLELSNEKSILLVFLRHFECVFCRESLVDLASKRKEIIAKDIEMVFVHMSSSEIAESYFDKYGLENSHHVSDVDCRYYLAFGLVKGRFNQLFGLQTALRGFEVVLTKGIFPNLTQVGDGLQMPGMFIIRNGIIEEKFIHKFAADKPDYNKLISCCSIN